MPMISCKDATFGYEGNTAISGLNFDVFHGNYICIVGENGSGKSTLVKGLLRLKTPHQGSISIANGLKQSDIGYLPQQTLTQKDFPASVYETVLSGRMGARGIRPFYSRVDKQTALNNMERLGISELRNRCYRELSGGQQQRVLLARALCAAYRLLILDEPVAGLDPIAAQELYHLISNINKDGMTIIMVSHDIDASLKYGSHILHLNGIQLFFGSVANYIKSDAYKRFGNFFHENDARANIQVNEEMEVKCD